MGRTKTKKEKRAHDDEGPKITRPRRGTRDPKPQMASAVPHGAVPGAGQAEQEDGEVAAASPRSWAGAKSRSRSRSLSVGTRKGAFNTRPAYCPPPHYARSRGRSPPRGRGRSPPVRGRSSPPTRAPGYGRRAEGFEAAPQQVAYGEPRVDRGNKHHWYTYLALRNRIFKSYGALHSLHSEMMDLSVNETKARVLETMKDMHEYMACPLCHTVTERLNETVFVNKCAHVYCKACFAQEGKVCRLCPDDRR